MKLNDLGVEALFRLLKDHPDRQQFDETLLREYHERYPEQD